HCSEHPQEQTSNRTQSERDGVTGLSYVPSDSMLPGRIVFPDKFLALGANTYYMSCNVTLSTAFLQRLNGTLHSTLLHLFWHACILYHSCLVTRTPRPEGLGPPPSGTAPLVSPARGWGTKPPTLPKAAKNNILRARRI
uniref:Uncharacterized protein n=1 Tax=Amazona collaria TaxID=241587 RepID=A0A8B9G3S3_9PSIT